MTSLDPLFTPLDRCWICQGHRLKPVHELIFEFSTYRDQDPELAAYTGRHLALVRCADCGFGQPAGVPTLDGYFARMYDQRWSEEWMAHEFTSAYKDWIFRTVLRNLAARLPHDRRSLLDVGAHVGRLLRMAQRSGWRAEGMELNPQTAAFAAAATSLPVHRADARALAASGRRYDAVSLIDVLEHIPDPVAQLETIRSLLASGGWIAVKVPNGPVQLRKELWRARVVPRYRPTVADNLVHVNHFSPRTLTIALQQAGFVDATIDPAAPEVVQRADASSVRRVGINAARAVAYTTCRILPGGGRTPLALHLQAYARAP